MYIDIYIYVYIYIFIHPSRGIVSIIPHTRSHYTTSPGPLYHDPLYHDPGIMAQGRGITGPGSW